MAQRKEDKQMDAEAQPSPSEVLSHEDSSKSKTREKGQESSSCSEKLKQMSLKSNAKDIIDSQQDISDSKDDPTSNASSHAETLIMDRFQKLLHMYQASNSEKSREEVRQEAIQTMERSGCWISGWYEDVEPGKFAIKHASSAPYHVFFTRIEKSKETYNQQFSITFSEILDRSLGEIVNSLHLNYMVDVDWLCWQYLFAGQCADMSILYGERVGDEKLYSNINMIHVDMPNEFGCHHSKIIILQYKDDGIRIVVSTANLYSDDWENRTQGLWISPHLPCLPNSANPNNGESPTGFKKDFKRYLNKYRHPALTQWIWAVRKADFSAVNVFFVASVPGTHKDNEINFWGYRKLGYVLSRHVALPPDASQWPIVAQSSSVGCFGPKFKGWLSKEIISCMSRETAKDVKSHPDFRFIYPSIENYKQSYDCENLSCCMLYSEKVHSKQEWIESYLCQWRATRTGQDQAMPHIKSYTRFSPDLKHIPWFVLTSANLSKAAWGVQRGNHYITNYEAGVIFIPKIITKTATFPVEDDKNLDIPTFPIPYDLPLSRYDSGDKPFVYEFFSTLVKT